MTDARDHFYIGRCMTCEWWEEFPRRPLRAKQRTRHHAKVYRMHQTCVIDVTALEIVAKYELKQRALWDDDQAEPPF